jgi:uncharacterized protein (DUF2062 family)
VSGFASWKRKVLGPLRSLAEQGMSAEGIALCVVLGIVLGVFPVFGGPTILCALAAFFLRLNLPAIQCVNYLAYPLQLSLLLPFIRLGEWLFRSEPRSAAFPHAYAWHAAYSIVKTGAHTIVAWFCVCAPAGLLLYILLACLLRRPRIQPAPVH